MNKFLKFSTEDKSIENLFFLLMVATVLLPLLPTQYIVTGDGPCHLYNSKILNDWHFLGNKAFYLPFLQLNMHIDPNWLTNLIQMPLLWLLPVDWAEKAFFCLYLLLFLLGFRRVIVNIDPQSAFLANIGALFAWSHILMMGFENNAWSIVLWFWVVALWMEWCKTNRLTTLLGVAILLLLTYLAHPIGLLLSLGSMFILSSVEVLSAWKEGRKEGAKRAWTIFGARLTQGILVALPVLILFLHFFLRREWKPESSVSNAAETARKLLKLDPLINFSTRERDIVQGIAILVFCLLLFRLWQRFKNRQMYLNDRFLLLFFAMLLIVFFPPNSIAGGLAVDIRLGMLPYLGLLFWLAVGGQYPRWVQFGTSLAALVFSVVLLTVRLPIMMEASKLAAEVVSCKESIQDNSTLLALNYDWGGKKVDGTDIANKIWLFGHVDCYLGAYRSMAISDNYEANYWYFPLIARWETNMYQQTDKDGINFDHRPPRADILSYERRSGGQKLDYVLLVSYQPSAEMHPYTKEIFDQLNSAYTLVHRSENGRAILYKRK